MLRGPWPLGQNEAAPTRPQRESGKSTKAQSLPGHAWPAFSPPSNAPLVTPVNTDHPSLITLGWTVRVLGHLQTRTILQQRPSPAPFPLLGKRQNARDLQPSPWPWSELLSPQPLAGEAALLEPLPKEKGDWGSYAVLGPHPLDLCNVTFTHHISTPSQPCGALPDPPAPS